MVDVHLPSLGESVTEGIILRWFKREGELVLRDEPLFEVSTDKVDSEMPSPSQGVLVKIMAAEGDTVETGALVAVIDPDGQATSAPAQSTPSTSAPVTPAVVLTSPEVSEFGVVQSPVVRRILVDGGVDPRTVAGSGPGGTITRRDAERAVAQGPTEEYSFEFSSGRRRMGEHLAQSWREIPHGVVSIIVDGEANAPIHSRSREEAIVVAALVKALAQHEEFNAYFAEGQLLVQRTINVGLARHLGGDGMLIPVIHATGGLSLDALERRIVDLDERLATRQLTTDDLMGATISVHGPSSARVTSATPIIVMPQVAALFWTRCRPATSQLCLTMSFDHRVFDATAATNLLDTMAELLEARAQEH